MSHPDDSINSDLVRPRSRSPQGSRVGVGSADQPEPDGHYQSSPSPDQEQEPEQDPEQVRVELLHEHDQSGNGVDATEGRKGSRRSASSKSRSPGAASRSPRSRAVAASPRQRDPSSSPSSSLNALPVTMSDASSLITPLDPSSHHGSCMSIESEDHAHLHHHHHPKIKSKMQQLMDKPVVKAVIAGAGFMCDAYDLFVINLVLVLLRMDPGASSTSSPSKSFEGLLADAVLIGSIMGQLIFGVLADQIGRRKGFIATLTLLTVGALLSATVQDTGSMTLYHWLALWRFVLGVGIGGEYPLAASVSSEASAEVKGRGKRVASVFAMQGVGATLAPLVVLILLSAIGPGNVGLVWRLALGLGAAPGIIMLYFRIRMKESTAFVAANAANAATAATATGPEANLLQPHHIQQQPPPPPLANGAVMSSVVADARTPEDNENRSEQQQLVPAVAVRAQNGDNVPTPPSRQSSSPDGGPLTHGHHHHHHRHQHHHHHHHHALLHPPLPPLSSRFRSKLRDLGRHGRDLMAASISWLILDVTFYGNGLFSSTILSEWYTEPDQSDENKVHDYLISVTSMTLYLALAALPGYIASVFTIDLIGRRKLQLLGFTGMVVSFVLCGALMPTLLNHLGAFFLLYSFTFFFSNFGPNTSTYVLPAELFPTSIRATAHGICAASGKAGAAIGGAMMPEILGSGSNGSTSDDKNNAPGLRTVMFVCAGIALSGLMWTYLFTRETMHDALTHGGEHDEAFDKTQEEEIKEEMESEEDEHQHDEEADEETRRRHHVDDVALGV